MGNYAPSEATFIRCLKYKNRLMLRQIDLHHFKHLIRLRSTPETIIKMLDFLASISFGIVKASQFKCFTLNVVCLIKDL